MLTDDRGEFTRILAATMDVYGRQITTGFVDIFFAALAPYDLPTVREALSRHLQDPDGGRFAPKPADLIRQIALGKSNDGRPGREEAWAIAQLAADETRTVILSGEIVGALEVARPLLEARDKVAARLAFTEAYDRLVSEKRGIGEPMQWHVSLGTDKLGRISAIEQAKVSGRLPAPVADLMIDQQRETPVTADGLAIAGLIGGPKVSSVEAMRAKWQQIRAKVAGSAREDKMALHRSEIARAERELEKMKESKQ